MRIEEMKNDITGELGVETSPELPTLRISDWIRTLGPVVTEPERSRILTRVTEVLGFEALWTLAPVEDDLFVRDCAGPVPVREETAAVLDLHARRRSRQGAGAAGVGCETARIPGLRDGRPVVVVFRNDGEGLVLAARLGERSPLATREVEILGALAEALHWADQEHRPEERSRRDEALRARLDRAVARAIREALDRTGGNRRDAAALLGVEMVRLAHEIDRLGLS
jgi:hypothetical protein